MAKSKRLTIGSVCKSKDAAKPDYIKINEDVTLKKGDFLNLESKAYKLKSLDEAVTAGRLQGDAAERIRKNIEEFHKDWVRFDIVQVIKD
jgi:hypothetical protein